MHTFTVDSSSVKIKYYWNDISRRQVFQMKHEKLENWELMTNWNIFLTFWSGKNWSARVKRQRMCVYWSSNLNIWRGPFPPGDAITRRIVTTESIYLPNHPKTGYDRLMTGYAKMVSPASETVCHSVIVRAARSPQTRTVPPICGPRRWFPGTARRFHEIISPFVKQYFRSGENKRIRWIV